jgi:hypothetical protein
MHSWTRRDPSLNCPEHASRVHVLFNRGDH